MQVRPRRLKVFGERNTGTVYLHELIARNLRVAALRQGASRPVGHLQAVVPGREWLRDAESRLRYRWDLGWKHQLVSAARLRRQGVAGVGFVTLTRDPWDWLLALRRAPYHLGRPAPATLREFVTMPWPALQREWAPGGFRDPVDLWNRKNAAYLELASALPTLLLRTDELVLRPEAVIERIALRFGLERRGAFVDDPRSSKGDGRSQAAIRRGYAEQGWRAEWDAASAAEVRRRLDATLVERFGFESAGWTAGT